MIELAKGSRREEIAWGAKRSDTWEIRTLAGEPTGLAGQRLNHSAKVSATVFLARTYPFKRRSRLLPLFAPGTNPRLAIAKIENKIWKKRTKFQHPINILT